MLIGQTKQILNVSDIKLSEYESIYDLISIQLSD